MTFSIKLGKTNPTMFMDPQKTQNCQSNSEAKEQSWRHRPSRLETILQSYSNQNNMVLAQKTELWIHGRE